MTPKTLIGGCLQEEKYPRWCSSQRGVALSTKKSDQTLGGRIVRSKFLSELDENRVHGCAVAHCRWDREGDFHRWEGLDFAESGLELGFCRIEGNACAFAIEVQKEVAPSPRAPQNLHLIHLAAGQRVVTSRTGTCAMQSRLYVQKKKPCSSREGTYVWSSRIRVVPCGICSRTAYLHPTRNRKLLLYPLRIAWIGLAATNTRRHRYSCSDTPLHSPPKQCNNVRLWTPYHALSTRQAGHCVLHRWQAVPVNPSMHWQSPDSRSQIPLFEHSTS